MKRFLCCLSALGWFYVLFLIAIWHLTEGFSINKITSNLSFSSLWEVQNPSQKEIESLLSQNFYYIGKGSQCYVFESEDKQIVLKFFRHSRYRLPKITQYISHPHFVNKIQSQKRKIKQDKLENLFKSCTLAYNELKEESGLLYLHLNKTDFLKKNIIIYDKLKRPYEINIDDYEFLIQVHGIHIFPYIARLIENGKKKEAKEAITRLALLVFNRLRKGIADDDAVIHKNSGFHAEKAIFLDVGEFSKKKCIDFVSELWETTFYLRQWLYENDEDLALYLENFMQGICQNV